MLRDVLERSLSTWTSVTCDTGVSTGLSVDVIDEENVCAAPIHYRGGRNVHAVTVVASGWASERGHDTRALAVTYVWHDPSTGEILDADIELNEENKDFHVCALPGCTDVIPLDSAVADLENTLTHELGHYFGLAHTPDDDLATMYAEASFGETTKRDLQPDDAEGICAIYPAGSLPDTCDPTPAGGLGLDCTAPPACGCHAPGTGGRAGAGLGLLAVALVLAIRARRR
jgi:MYXO-CTERM domain-containing protein